MVNGESGIGNRESGIVSREWCNRKLKFENQSINHN
jgi:hypothetical protein